MQKNLNASSFLPSTTLRKSDLAVAIGPIQTQNQQVQFNNKSVEKRRDLAALPF